MTIPATSRRSPVYTGNGASTLFPFAFKVFATTDIQVRLTSTVGALTTAMLGTDYSVVLNADQAVSPGGTITYPISGAPLAVGASLVAIGNLPYDQTLALPAGGNFNPVAIERALDRTEMQLQQIAELAGRGIRAPAGESLSDLPAAAARALMLCSFDAAGNVTATAPTAGTATALAATLLASTGSGQVGHIAAGAGATATTVQAKLRLFPTAADRGAVADFTTDNTAAVLAAVNALGVYGGTVVVPEGSKFNLRTVAASGPARFNLDYRADDDTSAPGPLGDIGTSERVFYSQNSSYPLDPTGNEVNEWVFTAPLHPGVIINARKDAVIPAGNLNGQSQTNPVRATIGIADEQTDRFGITYENSPTYSIFSQIKLRSYRTLCVLNGIGTANWVSIAPVNTTITGLTSGAKGFMVSVDAGSTTVIWFSGKFVAGEQLSDNNETASGTISSVATTSTEMQRLGQDFTKGNWSIGLPPGILPVLFGVGGKIASARTRSASQYVDVLVNDPGYLWVDSFEGAPPNGFEVIYDTSGGAAAGRLYKRKYGEVINRQIVGSLSAACIFGNGLAVNAKGFNVTSITKPGTGRYLVTATTQWGNTEYAVSLASDDLTLADRDQRVTAKGLASFEIRNYNAAGALADLVGNLDVKVHLGDI